MSSVRRNWWYRALAVWLSALLAVSGVPAVPVQAEELDEAGVLAVLEDETTTALADADDVASKEELGLEPADSSELEPADEGQTLVGQLQTKDGSTYRVNIAYDEQAAIPQGAKLVVRLLDDADEDVAALRTRRVNRALELDEGERVLETTYLDVRILSGGHLVNPASEVTMTIEADALDASKSASYELVRLADDDELTAFEHTHTEAAQLTSEERYARVDETPELENLTPDEADAETKLSAVTKRLGTFALASVVTPCTLWDDGDLAVSVLRPRSGCTLVLDDAALPTLPEGVEALACHSLQADPCPAYGTTFWLEARRNGWNAQDADELGGLFAYQLESTDTALDTEYLHDEALFGPEGTKEPIPMAADDGCVLLVWDSGYRSATLTMADVTVEGMMPEGTQGTARDVTKSYEDGSALVAGLDEETAAQVEEGTLEVAALAAYDIALEADGEEYQPDAEHPLTVTIVNDALVAGQAVQLWHVADDGTIEVIEDFELRDGAISFEALGFSEYVVVQERESETTDIALSSTFTIRASVSLYSRSSLVTFVDENRQPILGTVTGTINLRYTGGGTEFNEINSIDMYQFADKLDPAIADEYDFSRVYMRLTDTDYKDFRNIQVSDGTAIGQSASIYRAYFNIEGIEQNAYGKDYYGTWYQLTFTGDMDKIFIEFYHVGDASFYALDTRNDPVEGAEFALYTDPDCYVPFEYKHEEITAISDENGLVSFGKIPRGTYYMKETVIPEGYKKSTDIYEVVVDGESPIANVIHQDDDGSIIISDILRMTLTKEWDDGKDHTGDSVVVEVYARGEVVGQVTLSAGNDWTETLDGLDPNEPYMVSETCVMHGGKDVTQNWIPTITYEERDPHAEYYKADEFRKDKQYVLVTTTSSGPRVLLGDTSLTTIPIELSADKSQVTGTVTNDMLWYVDTITRDGVLALQNVKSGKYLDQNGRWLLNSTYPEPLYVRHINEDGVMRFYHRPNLNSATAYYLYIWYTKGTKAEGTVDRYMNDASKAGPFEIYRKVNVRSVDVTIANKETRYPIQIRNLVHPNDTPLANTTFDLYAQEEYSATDPGTPYLSSLTSGEDGYLRDGDDVQIELGAGTYYLCRTTDLESEGYAAFKPLKFVITRGGALKVAQEDQKVSGFTYTTSTTVGEATIPVLRVPNVHTGTLELTMAVEGDYADLTRAFEFSLSLPEGMTEIHATIDGEEVVLTAEHNTFALTNGQTIVLEDLPTTVDYVLTQVSDCVARDASEANAKYVPAVNVEESQDATVSAVVAADDWRVVTLSGLHGDAEHPARVQITETLMEAAVPDTGLADNALIWLAIVSGALIGLAALFVFRRRRVR